MEVIHFENYTIVKVVNKNILYYHFPSSHYKHQVQA